MRTSLQAALVLATSTTLLCRLPPTLAMPASSEPEPWAAPDLFPVRQRPVSPHAPLVLVRDHQPLGALVLAQRRADSDADLARAVGYLQQLIEEATGARLPILEPGQDQTLPAFPGPALVIGACPAAAELGLAGERMPVEGFAIRTTSNRVYIVGHDKVLVPPGSARSCGTAWGVLEFLERFVGVRWYYPDALGRDVPKRATLAVPPTWIEDAPVFRKREIWRTGHPFLRVGNSWPVSVRVHTTAWGGIKKYRDDRPEIYELKADGARDFNLNCFGSPRTLDTFLENLEAHFNNGASIRLGIRGDTITISPSDHWFQCRCAFCRSLWWPEAGRFGEASRIVGSFAEKASKEVLKRWPDKTLLYLPYANYTLCPPGLQFPGNVEVQLCAMPGLARYKDPIVEAAEQANIDAWIRASGRKIQNWHYSCWPADRTTAPYVFPHVIQNHYRKNRDKTVGSFINGPDFQHQGHWPRFHVSLYCWLKLLWNPDFNVDAALDEYCRRLYGPAAGTLRRLLQLQMNGWEDRPWPDGKLTPQAIHEISYPRKDVLAMQALLEQARQEAGTNQLVRQRISYYASSFEPFFQESAAYAVTNRTEL